MNASQKKLTRILAIVTGVYGLLWLWVIADARWFHLLESSESIRDSLDAVGTTVGELYGRILLVAIPLGIVLLVLESLPERRNWTRLAAFASVVAVFWWQTAVIWFGTKGWEAARAHTARWGTFGLYLIGLMWIVWAIERASQRYRTRRLEMAKHVHSLSRKGIQQATRRIAQQKTPAAKLQRIWNPLDTNAWYYGRKQRRLNQSLLAFVSYSMVFLAGFLILTNLSGCSEEYELPAGGGEQAQLTQQVKIQKVIRKKYVLNPLSSIIFKVPPIDEIRLQINERTRHAYKVGYGKGAGAGFAGGTKGGKVRFIRIEYDGGDWNHGMGIGADLNMLVQYGVRTKQQVGKKTESMRISRLRAFKKPEKNPPLLYVTGQRRLSVSKTDEKILKEYLLEKHGMLFGSAGSAQFGRDFRALMGRLLPTVRPVAIPLDDPIHRVPYPLPFFPYVAQHDGNQALGWKVDGRWVAYYHPGDIGDAWSDDHSGVAPSTYEACYQLGTNVIFYAHRQHAIFRESRSRK